MTYFRDALIVLRSGEGRSYKHLIQTLRRHQSNRSRSGSDIQKIPVIRTNVHYSAQQHAISIDLHGAALVYNRKSLELEYSHNIISDKTQSVNYLNH